MSDAEQKLIFSRNLNRYLIKSNKTQKEVAEAIGVIPSTFNTWCQGVALPRMGKVQALADYFGIQKTDLIDNKEERKDDRYYINEETAEMAQQIFENKELRVLFDAAKDADPQDLQTVHSMLLALKRKERGYSDID